MKRGQLAMGIEQILPVLVVTAFIKKRRETAAHRFHGQRHADIESVIGEDRDPLDRINSGEIC